jgi:signal transduction histidine kinase
VTALEERNKQLEVIDTVMRHNLRNSLTAIGLLAERLHSRTDGELTETADKILRNAEDLRETGEKSRAITSVLADPPTREPVDITEVVQSLAGSVESARPDARLTVETPESAVAAATLKIGDAFEELVRNAVTHSDQNSPGIELRVETHSDTVAVSVTDDGPGMSEMDRDVLERGAATDDLYHGGGLGLWLVYWIVSRAGGTVTVSDAEPRGTSVTVTLPRYTESDR